MSVTALLDGDIVAFRAAAAVAKSFDWGDGEKSVASDPDGAAEGALQTIEAWRTLAKCRDVIVCFSAPHNFRKVVLPSYKSNRTAGKPPDYWTTVAAVQEAYPCRVVDGLEADDLMGILATTDRFIDRAIVVTLDKDLRTVPGVHFNPTKDSRPVRVTEAQADHKWLMQTLHGDTTDGYTGIPGIGPKRAEKLLCTPTSSSSLPVLWSRVMAAYRKAGLTEDDALAQARVARILRRSDYDRTTKEVILWSPTNPVRLPLATVCGASARTSLGASGLSRAAS